MIPPLFAATPEALARALENAPVESLPGGYALAMPRLSAPLIPAQDRRNRWDFPRAGFLYAPRKSRRGQGLHLTLSLHYEDEDRTRAEQIGRLAARLMRLHQTHFGRETAFPRASEQADIWLTPRRPLGAGGAHLGGETWNNQLYIYATRMERSSLEWTRTLAHEWGHLTLPAARGYEEPEGDAAGFLGERLYLNWLFEEQSARASQGGVSADGVTLEDMTTYRERQVRPLLERFMTGGPESRAMRGKQAEHMDYYIAAALAFERAVGSPLLGKALFTITDVGPGNLLEAMVRVMEREREITVRLPAWVPLPEAAFLLTGDSPGAVALATRPPLEIRPDPPVRLQMKVAGWKRLRAVGGTLTRLTLRRA